MPYEIVFDNLPIGYAAEAARSAGQTVKVITNEFTSSEDGDLFISRLEGFPSDVIRRIRKESSPVKESTIDHLVIILRSDKTATVYVNELIIKSKVLVKRAVKAGEEVYKDDIGDVKSVLLEGVNVPDDAGFLILFSVGWRKGLYYDFRPLSPEDPIKRDLDLSVLLGQLYSYLLFQERWRVSEETWIQFFSQGWFPFISLRTDTIKIMINHIREGWPVDDLLASISAEVGKALPMMLERWRDISAFSEHVPFFDVAAGHFTKNDHISCTSVLCPRIEGVMRSFHILQSKGQKATQDRMAKTVTSSEGNESSLLLPDRFRKYLLDVYFANFDPEGQKPLSRHTVSHGVAEASKFDLKASTIGFLVIEQLSYFIKASANKSLQPIVDTASSGSTLC
jgi:hypothetical protein